MKLKARDLPTLTIRKALPAFLAGGDACYIEVDARPGGAVNTAYLAGMEQASLNSRTRIRMLGKVEDDAEHVAKDREYTIAIVKDWLAVVYDTCVMAWRSNVLDDGKLIAPTRENFMDLAEERVPELATALAEIRGEILKAGEEMLAATKDVEKN